MPAQPASTTYMLEQEVVKVFQKYDIDGDGLLSPEECFAFIRDIVREQMNEEELSNEQLQLVFHSLDLDGNGAID